MTDGLKSLCTECLGVENSSRGVSYVPYHACQNSECECEYGAWHIRLLPPVMNYVD